MTQRSKAPSMSDKKSIDQKIQTVTGIAEEIANPLGLLVVDVRFGQQGRRHTLDVTIFQKRLLGLSVGL